MSSPTVLFVVPRFHTNIYFATQALKEAGIRVAVFANRTIEGEDHSIVTPHIFGRQSSEWEVEKALEDLQPDLIFLRNSQELSRQVRELAQKRSIRTLIYDQNPLNERRSLLKLFYHRLRGKPIERVTPVRGLDWQAPIDSFAHYLPWPVMRASKVASNRNDTEQIRILCVGKLVQPRKNQHLLLESLRFSGLADKVQLTFVGSTAMGPSGSDQKHLEYLLGLAEENWIEVLCDHPFEKMGELYASTDICVLPSFSEPLGTAPVEAMAYGAVPVISTECGSAGYIEHGNNGFRVNIRKHGELEWALKQLVTNRSLRERLSENARITAECELGPESFVQRIRDLLDYRRA